MNIIKEYIENSKELRDNDLNIVEMKYKKKLNSVELEKEFTEKRMLLVAPPGSGKTYSIDKIDKGILLLAVPSRMQTLQVRKQYGMWAVCGTDDNAVLDTKIESIDLSKCKKVVFTYDKAEDILAFVRMHKDEKYFLAVDEAHQLIKSSTFRKEATANLKKLIDYINADEKSQCIFMTATPLSLITYDFDKIINCTTDEDVNFFENIEIVYNNENQCIDTVHEIVMREISEGNRLLIRYNSYRDLNELSLRLKMGDIPYKMCTSKNKDFDLLTDEDGNKFIKYKNEIYNQFVFESSLPDTKVCMVTSLIDEGGNIETIENVGQDENTSVIFVVKRKQFFSLDSIQQFAARIRFKYKKLIIIINRFDENEENSEVYSYKEIFEKVYRQVNTVKKIVGNMIELLSLRYSNPVILRYHLEKYLEVVDDGYRLDMGCIDLTDDFEIVVNDLRFQSVVFDKFMEQYYSSSENLVSIIEKRFEKKVQIVKVENHKFDNNALNEVILYFTEDKSSMLQVYNSKIYNSELKTIEHSEIYKNAQKLIRTRRYLRDKEEPWKIAKQSLLDALSDDFENIYHGYIIQILKLVLQKKSLDINLTSIFGEFYTKDTDPELKEIIKDSKVYDYVKRFRKYEVNEITVLDKLIEYEFNKKKLNQWERDLKFRFFNRLYIEDQELCYNLSRFGKEQSIILGYTYKMNEKGRLKKLTLNSKLLSAILEDLSIHFDADGSNSCTIRTEETLKKRIKNMFTLQDNDTKISAIKI